MSLLEGTNAQAFKEPLAETNNHETVLPDDHRDFVPQAGGEARADRLDRRQLSLRPLPLAAHPPDTRVSAARARAIVMEVERGLGFEPVDREFEKVGYDIESRGPTLDHLRFLEVKGRVSGAETITVTKNEILTALNQEDQYILAMVEFFDDTRHRVLYLKRPFEGLGLSTEFNAASVNVSFAELLARGEYPR